MDSVVVSQKKISSKKQEQIEVEENKKIMQKISEIEDLIETNNNVFNYVIDEELIDGCIYELNALYQKHSYYIKLCKNKGIVSEQLLSAEKRGYN